MIYTIVQYIFIAAVFGVAVWYLIGMIKESFGKKKSNSCNKGCGCDTEEDSKLK